ncbi:MAG: hypothetical protein WB817_19130 [Terriglobales bacterium]
MGFCIALAVLSLLWFGVAGILNVGRIDLMYILWPSSLMLTVGWHTTTRGIATAIMSVAINCLLYMAVAGCLYRIVLAINKSVRS